MYDFRFYGICMGANTTSFCLKKINDIFVYFHSNEKAGRGYYSEPSSVASQKLPESRGLGTWSG
jgi:hypothetical protein